MNYDVVYRQNAVNDLSLLHEYITNQLKNPMAADNVARKILHTVDTLDTFPERGRLLGTDNYGYNVRIVTSSNYNILFGVNNVDKVVYIYSIENASRNVIATWSEKTSD